VAERQAVCELGLDSGRSGQADEIPRTTGGKERLISGKSSPDALGTFREREFLFGELFDAHAGKIFLNHHGRNHI
jgi:hypothetical protein